MPPVSANCDPVTGDQSTQGSRSEGSGSGFSRGVAEAGYIALRLPLEIADLFDEWLASEVPDRAGRVMKLVREMRGGRTYDPRFGTRMTGTGPLALLLARRFRIACARLGLNTSRFRVDCSRFRPPPRPGDQLGLF